MENFFNAAVIWFMIGFIFLLLEFLVPGFILFFFAVGAWVVATWCLFDEPSINTQLLVFLAASGVSIVLFRRSIRNYMQTGKRSNEIMEDEFIGKTARVEVTIVPGKDGKVDFKGTTWDAKSDVVIEKDSLVTIVDNDSILLIVKPLEA